MRRSLALGALRSLSPVVGFGLQGAIVRTIGLGGAGSLAVLVSISSAIAVLIGLGTPGVVSRLMALDHGHWTSIVFSGWALVLAGTAALVTTITVLGLVGVPLITGPVSFAVGFLAGATALQAQTVAANRGAGRPIIATLVELYLSRAVLLVVLATVSIGVWSIDEIDFLWAAVVGSLVAGATGLIRIVEVRGPVQRPSTQDARSLMTGSGLLLVNQIALLLTAALSLWSLRLWSSPADTGSFHLATRLALFAGVPGTVVQLITGPELARRAASGTLARYQHRLVSLVGTATIVSLGISIVAFSMHRIVLELITGEPMPGLAWPVAILLVGQVVHVSTGPCGYALIMGRFETVTCRATLTGLAFTALASFALVPRLASTGAAIATVAGIAVTNVLNARGARRSLGLRFSWLPAVRTP